MGIRKNVKHLDPGEREAFVRACVLMKADIVNPGAPPDQRYSRWDELVAIHRMIQAAFAPGDSTVNFGHGGDRAFGFLSWHRYFLYRVEKQLQTYVPGVMIPYWDWTDPAVVMTDTFLGANPGGGVIQQGYFAFDRPGVGVNAVTLPGWWPSSLDGWRLPAAFGTWAGGLRRDLSPPSTLPSVNDLRFALARLDLRRFQSCLESGAGLPSGHQMHNGLHGWIGGHMSAPAVSPFDPLFYLHHCNVDRLWAMWQADGHATEFPTSGGWIGHNASDLMYPWTGGATGYGTNSAIAASIPMPDFSGDPAVTNGETTDYRGLYGYTYDTLPVMGIGLDRTGSMTGLTPDPMVTTAPDVTKWVAARRGVSAFLQDCETVQDSAVIYVTAGVETFRSLGANVFDAAFGGPGYGLIKAGTPFSKASFDAAAGAMSPGGGTPLADALSHVQATLVEPPFSGVPADERRYLAMLTDGMLTSGSPLSSIPDGSLPRTTVFAMGFGTGADVDYATLAALVAKGQPVTSPQVFHGESAGTIDKFFSNALAQAIGFTTVFDPIVELFAGEHTHLPFDVTSADDVLLLTAQGMDFDDEGWTFSLHDPRGTQVYGDGPAHGPHDACDHCCPRVVVTTRRADGRLTLVLQRAGAPVECWVGRWQLQVAYRARRLDAMAMPSIGQWLFSTSAGPVRGPKWSRLLRPPKSRAASRVIAGPARNVLDERPLFTGRESEPPCSLTVNIYARSRLRIEPVLVGDLLAPGAELKLTLDPQVSAGGVKLDRAFARLVAPTVDLAAVVDDAVGQKLPKGVYLRAGEPKKLDTALVLAHLEKRDPCVGEVRDEAVRVVSHDGGPLHVHYQGTQIPGTYHLGILIEGTYFPGASTPARSGGGHDHGAPAGISGRGEPFTRLVTVAAAVASKGD